jgi:hypothetical protein
VKRDLPGLLFLAGTLLELATIEVKKLDWEFVAGSNLFMWGCGALAISFFAGGLLFALRSLLTGFYRCYALAFIACNLLAIVAVFGLQITEYVIFSKIYALPVSPTQLLPKLIDDVRSAGTEEKRRGWAQAGYRAFGVELVYRKDDGSLVAYEPSSADQEFWKHLKAGNDQNASLRESIIGGQLKQLPDIFIINASALVITFLGAAVVLAFRSPPSVSVPD